MAGSYLTGSQAATPLAYCGGWESSKGDVVVTDGSFNAADFEAHCESAIIGVQPGLAAQAS